MDTGYIYIYIYYCLFNVYFQDKIKYSYHTGPNPMKNVSPLKALLSKDILCLFTDL
jgi:hypothetical protein